MRKIWLPALIFGMTLSLFPQQVAEESMVINIEVPVRVFKGDTFIDTLTIDDFEVLEDGIPQKIEAVYLVRKRNIERSEEKRRFSPDTARNFYLFFEVTEYNERIGQAVDYFIKNIIDPGDMLTIMTPIKTYRLRGKALEVQSRDEVVTQLKGLLRRDTLQGNSEYRNTIQELSSLAASLSASISRDSTVQRRDEFFGSENLEMSMDEQLARYQSLLAKLESLRYVDQEQLLKFAQFLENKKGQKYVFLFYQREYVPQIDDRILNQYMEQYQDRPDLQQAISGITDFYRRDISFDLDHVKRVYADCSISIHFLFIAQLVENRYGITFHEQSEDIFSAFREMARATGGYIESSANPRQLVKSAVEASENYYLLYYTPQNYSRDGDFRNIEVKIKDNNYRVVHRLGYYAD
jgi:VWFA-related protein